MTESGAIWYSVEIRTQRPKSPLHLSCYRAICLTHDHELEHWSRHLKIHAAIVIHLDRCGKIEVGERNFLRGLLIEYPERSTGDCVIPYFFNMLVAENQRRRGFLVCLRSIARFDIGLQTVDLSAQRLYIALQSAILGVGAWIRGSLIGSAGIRILILVFRVIEERIVVPAVIAVRIISRVRIVGVIAPSSVEASMIVEGVSSPNVKTGAVTKTSAVKRARGVYTRGV